MQVTDTERFIRNFVPPNTTSYSFASDNVRAQISAEFLQSFVESLNELSARYRVSQLPSHAQEVAAQIASDSSNAGTWRERFGFGMVAVGIENIELTPESRDLVNQYSSNRMDLKAYEGISQEASNIGAQQKYAQGVQDHGLGDGAGMMFGIGLAQGISPQTAATIRDELNRTRSSRTHAGAGSPDPSTSERPDDSRRLVHRPLGKQPRGPGSPLVGRSPMDRPCHVPAAEPSRTVIERPT